MFRKGKSAVEGDLEKCEIGIEAERGDKQEELIGHPSKRRLHICSDGEDISTRPSSRISAPCVTSIAAGTEGEEGQMARLSIKREQLTEEGRKAGGSLMKRDKSTGPKTDSCGIPRRLKRSDFCDFVEPPVPVRLSERKI